MKISDEEKDDRLEEKLAAEAPGILNRLIEGLMDYRERGGLAEPDEVRDAVAEYRSDSDAVGRFISEWCVTRDGEEADAAELYDAFAHWSRIDGMKEPLSANLVGRALTNRGLAKRKSHGRVIRLGIALSEDGRAQFETARADAIMGGPKRRGAKGDPDDPRTSGGGDVE